MIPLFIRIILGFLDRELVSSAGDIEGTGIKAKSGGDFVRAEVGWMVKTYHYRS